MIRNRAFPYIVLTLVGSTLILAPMGAVRYVVESMQRLVRSRQHAATR
ncbi:MAG: hypothetical protein ABIW50_03955 [Candidatus Limnocylindria bacterium]